jgi:hypothetical protein
MFISFDKKFSTVENEMSDVSDEELKEKILAFIRKARRPLDINHIAKHFDLSWWPTYRLITEIIIDKLKADPGGTAELPFVLIKSTKSFIIFPKHLSPVAETKISGG